MNALLLVQSGVIPCTRSVVPPNEPCQPTTAPARASSALSSAKSTVIVHAAYLRHKDTLRYPLRTDNERELSPGWMTPRLSRWHRSDQLSLASGRAVRR